MKKYKLCEVLLISENIDQLYKWKEEIEETFENIYTYNYRECFFKEINTKDYRLNVQFESNETKNNIYVKMNKIKANPIKFLGNAM